MIGVEGPIASTAYGELQGLHSKGVDIWRGVPYAAPPIGALRFAAPRPPEAWSEIREATAFGPVSHQPPDLKGTRFGGTQPPHSEDCLYLNIWSPAAGGENLPVMVWIHGGTFVTGSGSQPLFDGASLASAGGVVVVSINYRLGPLGFLHLSPLGGDFASNAGLLDQIAALEWVQENIAAFRGDPGRVTVFGESAGSMSIAALLAMPAAKGLFAGAIMQSGAAQALQPQQGEQITAAFLAELGLTSGKDAALLRTLPADKILRAAVSMNFKLTGGGPAMLFQPVIDKDTLPRNPLDAVAGGSASGIPLLIGTNRDEGAYFFRDGAPQSSLEQSVQALEMLTGEENLTPIVREYPATAAGQAEVMTDLYFWKSAVAFAESYRSYAPVWMYRFDWTVPGHPLLSKAVHGAEIAYAFNNLSHLQRLGLDIHPSLTAVAQAMQGAWIAFARQGDPSTPEKPWPPYNPEERATLIFDKETDVRYDPDSEKRKRLFREE